MFIDVMKPIIGASITGVLTNMIVSQSKKRGTLDLKVQTLGAFMQAHGVSTPTQHQVLAYLEHAENHMQTLADLEAIKALSPTLQEEVAFETTHHVLNTFPSLKCAFGDAFLRELCNFLHISLFGPDEVVYQEGHFCSRMVFLSLGCLKLFQTSVEQNDEPVVQYRGDVNPGNTFAAQALFLNTFRSRVTAVCFVFCQLHFLTRAHFEEVASRHPDWQLTLTKVRRALDDENNPSKLVDTWAAGELDSLMEVCDKEAWRKRSRLSFQRYVKKVMLRLKAEKSMLGCFDVKDLKDSTNEIADEGTTGFQTMEMSPQERRLMKEFAKMRSALTEINPQFAKIHLALQELSMGIANLDSRLSAIEMSGSEGSAGYQSIGWDSAKFSPASTAALAMASSGLQGSSSRKSFREILLGE